MFSQPQTAFMTHRNVQALLGSVHQSDVYPPLMIMSFKVLTSLDICINNPHRSLSGVFLCCCHKHVRCEVVPKVYSVHYGCYIVRVSQHLNGSKSCLLCSMSCP